ncbi:MAG: peptidylprolyl isomerase [Pirellula sp.]|jgi:parvulin-like peptidyl-prolyl isomerase|nr:peptidylprolyl isomerase [Pirellula sp.]
MPNVQQSRAQQSRAQQFFAATLTATCLCFPAFSLTQGTLEAQDRTGATSRLSGAPASARSSIKDSEQATPSESGPAIVALVNGQKIVLQDLANLCVLRHGEEVLENMVNRYLILQACQERKIEIKQKDVDDEIARIASKFNLSVQMYLKLLENERDIRPEYYASDIVWPMLALRELSKDMLKVSPQDIDRAFQSEFGPKVQVRMIATKDSAKLQQVHQQATANPELFKTLAREHSEDPASASVEGLLPPIRMNTGEDELERIAFALQPGQVSEIFKVGDLNVTLQCVRHMPPANPPAAQLAEIQGRIKSELEEQKLRESAETIYTELRNRSQIVTVLGQSQLQQQYPGIAAVINGQSVTMEILEKECVKRFGNKILEGEINRKLVEDALTKSGQAVTQAEVDQEIRNTALFYGYINADGTPDVQRWVADVLSDKGKTIEMYVRDAVWPTVALKKLCADQVQITEEDVRMAFEANFGQRAEILAIVMSNQRTAQEVWEMARGRNTEQFFGELANQYSVEPSSRANFGKVPPLRKHGGQASLEKAAFGLKPGEMSGIIEVGGQYVILRSQGFTDPVVQDINAVKEDLVKEIREKKLAKQMDSMMAKLSADAQITNILNPKKSRVGNAEMQASLDELKKSEVKR